MSELVKNSSVKTRKYFLVRGGLEVVLRVPTHKEVIGRGPKEILASTLVRVGKENMEDYSRKKIMEFIESKVFVVTSVLVSKVNELLSEKAESTVVYPSDEEMIAMIFNENKATLSFTVNYDDEEYKVKVGIPVGTGHADDGQYDVPGVVLSRFVEAIGEKKRSEHSDDSWRDVMCDLPFAVATEINNQYAMFFDRATKVIGDPDRRYEATQNF